MEIMNKGLTVPKKVLLVQPKIYPKYLKVYLVDPPNWPKSFGYR